MGIKAYAAKWFAKTIHQQTNRWASDPEGAQQKAFNSLISSAKETSFGEDHDFGRIKTYRDFKEAVPIRDYEQLNPYIKKIIEGAENVLWPGRPLYFAKTSGTTSGIKYIPISKESMQYQVTEIGRAHV